MSAGPVRRSSSSSQKKSKARSSSGSLKKEQREQDRWIFLAKEELTKGDYSADDDVQPSLCLLRHPRLDQGVMFFMSADCKSVYEINSFEEKCRSWFIGNKVHSDGKVYLTTPVDPVFLVLPYLINAGKSNRFMSLSQIVCDEDLPDCQKLLACSDLYQLDQVTDIKDVDEDLRVYRYNSDKAVEWLKAKTEMAADALQEKKVAVDSHGSQSSFFIRSKHQETSRDSYIKFACGLISDYLPLPVEEELKKALGIEDKEPETVASEVRENEPPQKKLKTDISPTEDYSQKTDLKKAKSVGKLTAAQKKLSKVDKSGMKSISSFFSKPSS